MAEESVNVAALAKDLSKEYPRSPRTKLAGYVVAARTLDRCRAHLNGTPGPYNFNGGMDRRFFEFTGIEAEAFRAYVATGANDEAVAAWITTNAKQTSTEEVIAWNNKMRALRICDLPMYAQVFLEGYVEEFLPKDRVPYVWFDVYDIEEGRI